MNLMKIVDALVRRWWVALPIVLMTVGAVIWIASGSTAEYQARARLLLASPAIVGVDTESPDQENERAILDPVVVREIAEGDATRAQIGVLGNDVDYSITDVGNGIFRIETVSSDEDSVLEVAPAVIEAVEGVVAELDAADADRTAEVQILSEPRFVRQRTVETDEGVETEYFARGSMALVISGTGASGVTGDPNPYSASVGTLRVLEELSSTEAVLAAVREEVGDSAAAFELQFDTRDAAPLVHVVATATTPETTMATLDSVLMFLDEDLQERQALTGANESTFVRLQRLSVPDEAEVPEGSLRRPIATIIVLGLVGAVSLAVLVDSLMTARTGGEHLSGARRGGNGSGDSNQDESKDPYESEDRAQTRRSRAS